MPPKKRSAPKPESSLDTEDVQTTKKISDGVVIYESLSLKEMLAGSLPIVVVPQTQVDFPREFDWRVGFPAGYVSGAHLRTVVYGWLTGSVEDFDLVAFVLKCGHFTALAALNPLSEVVSDMKWMRLVDFLCVMYVAHIDLRNFGEALHFWFKEISDQPGFVGCDKNVLECDLTELTVAEVALLVSMADVVTPTPRWTALYASYLRLECPLKSDIPTMIKVGNALEEQMDDEEFIKSMHVVVSKPEEDVRIKQYFDVYKPMYTPSSPMYSPSSPVHRVPFSPSHY